MTTLNDLTDLYRQEIDISEFACIPDGLFEKVKSELASLRAACKNLKQNSDELDKAFALSESITWTLQDLLEHRGMKVLRAAEYHARTGERVDLTGALEQEKIAYNQIVDRLQIMYDLGYKAAGVREEQNIP